ncbi:MAG: hypothetical protein ACTHN5_05840 [Phycisphaerae bacterium]
MLSELSEAITEADTPYLLWLELRLAFEYAYEAPRNESLIKRIYEYARWCETQPRGKTAEDDLLTATAVCFIEHIPEHPQARMDMPRWFTLDQIVGMESLFRYRISAEDFSELKQMFIRAGQRSSTGKKKHNRR